MEFKVLSCWIKAFENESTELFSDGWIPKYQTFQVDSEGTVNMLWIK